jgi:hypothetical protein
MEYKIHLLVVSLYIVSKFDYLYEIFIYFHTNTIHATYK